MPAEEFSQRVSGDLSWPTAGLGNMIGLRETFRIAVPEWKLMHNMVKDFLVFVFLSWNLALDKED